MAGATAINGSVTDLVALPRLEKVTPPPRIEGNILELKKLPYLKSVEIVGCKELKGTPVRDAVSNYFPCFILLYVFRHHPTCTGDQQELKDAMKKRGKTVKVQISENPK